YMRPDLLDSSAMGFRVDEQILTALADDLNTSLALTKLRAFGRFIDNSREYLHLSEGEQLEQDKIFVASAELLGFPLIELASRKRDALPEKDLEFFAARLAQERNGAKHSKDFSAVDRLKAGLVEAGVEVKMGKDNVELVPGPNFDPAKLEALK
ncbi:MAG: hypothetical protein OEZ19_08295, partial [Paracoccaceae bacterium]|nr:hypothetical protein [Paracoccaceae bacterium]